jgi:hypothetical protein
MKFRSPNPRRLFVATEKKSLINNLKTTRKAIVASTPGHAKVSGKVTPRNFARTTARMTTRVRTRVKGKV